MKWISLFIVLLLLSCEVTTGFRSDKTYVIITFDDGHKSIYYTALPIMEEFGFRATNVINTGIIGNEISLTWLQVEELEFEHGWETAGHTLHHITLPTVPIEIVEYEIHQDWLNLIDHGLSHSTFALPSGKASQEHYDIILQYYQNVRTSLNITTYAPIDRTDLGYYPYLSCYSAETAEARILQAVENNECLIIIGFHRVMEETAGHPCNCKPDDFHKIMKFISDNHLEVITINEACELLSG